MTDTAICAGAAVWWFGVPFRGSWTVLFACSMLFLIVVLSLGYLISVTAKSQLGASQMALLATLLPTFLLSGFIFPIDQMPVVVQWITRVPAGTILRLHPAQRLSQGHSESRFWLPEIAALAVIASGPDHSRHARVPEEAGMNFARHANASPAW